MIRKSKPRYNVLPLSILSDDEIREQLYDMTLREILEKRKLNKRWKKIIDDDKFWCRLLNRDYKIRKTKDCKKSYQHEYKDKNVLNFKFREPFRPYISVAPYLKFTTIYDNKRLYTNFLMTSDAAIFIAGILTWLRYEIINNTGVSNTNQIDTDDIKKVILSEKFLPLFKQINKEKETIQFRRITISNPDLYEETEAYMDVALTAFYPKILRSLNEKKKKAKENITNDPITVMDVYNFIMEDLYMGEEI